MEKYLVVGLGNIGFQYEDTKHNIGFKVIDSIANKLNFSLLSKGFNSYYWKMELFDKEVFFMKPTTLMNLSGNAVSEIVNFYKIKKENILVIYDDLDTNIGKIKLRHKGSSGGQNGIKHIISLMGTENIKRIKVGISRPEQKISISGYVLSKFNTKDLDNVNKAVELAREATLYYLENDFVKAMNKFNR